VFEFITMLHLGIFKDNWGNYWLNIRKLNRINHVFNIHKRSFRFYSNQHCGENDKMSNPCLIWTRGVHRNSKAPECDGCQRIHRHQPCELINYACQLKGVYNQACLVWQVCLFILVITSKWIRVCVAEEIDIHIDIFTKLASWSYNQMGLFISYNIKAKLGRVYVSVSRCRWRNWY